ncbi:hypothetical protein JL721_6847 [Aureococcus anophagefferens]|nr:hypothetical protein JL721_6847 [Aureococcus anophagefferens]
MFSIMVDGGSDLGAAVAAATAAPRRRDGADGELEAGGDLAVRRFGPPPRRRPAPLRRRRGACALPPRSATLLAAADRWARPLLRRGRRYDVVTATTPPTRRVAASARRKGAYAAGWDAWRRPLRRFPLPRLASERGAVVAVWVTNDAKVADFVRRDLFPKWKVEYVATWYWLKVTASGAPVLPVDAAAERKPWEPLLVGVVNGAGEARPRDAGRGAPRGRRRGGARRLARRRRPVALPAALAFASPPAAHSAKPLARFAACFGGAAASTARPLPRAHGLDRRRRPGAASSGQSSGQVIRLQVAVQRLA